MKTNTFVYLTIDDVKKIANASKFYYKTLMWFMFDSGIRSPTELMNVRCSDLEQMKDSNNFELNIRDEVSKTFGRRIKLLICSDLLKEFIATNELKNQDYLFTKHPRTTNKYIKRIAEKVLGDKMTKAGEGIKSISLYDFRHASACYWLPRYKSESALKYRFGWKRGEMIHRYTKLLGMKDTIQESDMLLQSEAKTKLEKEIEIMKTQNEIMQDKLKQMEEMLTKTRIPLTEKIIKKNISRLTKEEKNELGL
jgi:integrase